MAKSQSTFKRVLRSRVFTVLVLVVITLLGTALYRDYTQQQEVRTELDQLEQEITQLKGKKLELAKMIDILETSNYIEQEARKNLGLKKPGERVVSIPEDARPQPRVAGAATQHIERPTNPVMWFDYFFRDSGRE